MKNQFLRLLLLSMVIFIANSCDEDGNDDDCLEGSGSTIVETRDIQGFTSIGATIVGNVYVTQGAFEPIRIESHANVIAELKTEVEGGQLNIFFDRCANDIEKLDVFVTLPVVDGLFLSGVGNIFSTNDITSDNLSVALSGVGNVNIQGEVDVFDFALSGVGDLRAFDLVTNESRVTISGVGDAEVTVNKDLEATISGVGNVSYKGEPTLAVTVSGAGGVINAN